MSFSPVTRLVYIPASLAPTIFKVEEGSAASIGGDVQMDWTSPLKDPAYAGKAGRLIAWDPIAQKSRWSVDLPVYTNGGVLSTLGNLVFQGTGDGWFNAYDASTGRKLWSISIGSSVQAAPSTVKIDGEQLILLPVGIGGGIAKLSPQFLGTRANGPSRLLAFSLHGSAKLPPVLPEAPFEKPPRPKPTSAALVARGRRLFADTGCQDCHGPGAVRQVGESQIPDLRRASAETHDEFPAIVIGGLRRAKGMPVFADALSVDDVSAIEAFVLSQAWAAYETSSSRTTENR
jgi:quinohemoprotein ethanol dehydrogenase